MSMRNTVREFGVVSRLFHWSGAVLVIAALVVIELRGYFPRGSDMSRLLLTTHILCGLLVLVTTVLRLPWRLSEPVQPQIQPPPPRFILWLANSTHWLLYGVMLLQPLLGILFIQANGRPVQILGYALPQLINTDAELGALLKDVHLLLGNLLIPLVVGHIVAAFIHHFWRRDTTLKLMMPNHKFRR